MKIDEIREMNDADLREEIAKAETEIMNLRMGNTIGTVDNPLQIRFRKRDVARMNTVVRERELKIR
jgi:large subunit ribosomal protein L29